MSKRKQRPLYYPQDWQKEIDQHLSNNGELSFNSWVRRLMKQDIEKSKTQAHAS